MGKISEFNEKDYDVISREYADLKEAARKRCADQEEIDQIQKAFEFANEAHKGVRRRSGEPYILHPIAVAKIVVSNIGLGYKSIVAALLHDVVGYGDMLGVYGLVYYVNNTILHFVVAIYNRRTVVEHYVELLINHIVADYQRLVVEIPFTYRTLAEIGHVVVPLYQVHAGNDVSHGVAQLMHQRRSDAGILEFGCALGGMVDAVLLLHIFF